MLYICKKNKFYNYGEKNFIKIVNFMFNLKGVIILGWGLK